MQGRILYENALGLRALRDVICTGPRKIAESTGRLPPTPMDHMVANAVKVIWSRDPPADVANMPTMSNVTLKEIL
jgi:hypothetical protein